MESVLALERLRIPSPERWDVDCWYSNFDNNNNDSEMQASTFDQQSLMLGHSQSMIMGDQSVAGSVFGDTSAAPSRAGSVRPLSPGKEMILNYSKCS